MEDRHPAELAGKEDEYWAPELFHFHGNMGKTYDLSGGTCGFKDKTLGNTYENLAYSRNVEGPNIFRHHLIY